ncbi:MAG: cysteine--tRNA ligase [Holosporales bacterium]|nr:cysteine--tRNA ligase [Holosporales bacterium]
MKLRLYNTLSKKLDFFKPIDEGNVRMYVCGPTVYDRAHLGNARPAVVFDVLYRLLKTLYRKVTYVRNITDIDDKIYNSAIEKGIGISELTEKTIEMYHDDVTKLNVLPVDIEPRATNHIEDIIDFIDKLIANDSAYISEGHVYFDVSSFARYGALSKKNLDELINGTRVEISDFKRNSLDFVLWKPIDDKFNFGWKSPWGVGRPGWHIECSAMAMKYLGEHFDIHGGGIDLVFPHHENEMAQSCALSNEQSMANYWLHNGHLNIEGIKMSKSLGNFFTVNELLKKYDGEVIRMAFLMTHYSAPQNFSLDVLEQAKSVLDHWYTITRDTEPIPEDGAIPEVLDALLDDMNTPRAIAILSSVKTVDTRFVNTCRDFLGILTKGSDGWFCKVSDEKKEWINVKIAERAKAKCERDYAMADAIRNELFDNNIILEDTKDGTIWKVNT